MSDLRTSTYFVHAHDNFIGIDRVHDDNRKTSASMNRESTVELLNKQADEIALLKNNVTTLRARVHPLSKGNDTNLTKDNSVVVISNDDRNATQDLIVKKVLLTYSADCLTHSKINEILRELKKEMREGGCSWAFKSCSPLT